ncbi:hypothetical protein EDD21DRAFT_388891 [Dissophora ornata]|nr:hypothetical protein EDD21DRAFT_388891 [Dissophora ornata]
MRTGHVWHLSVSSLFLFPCRWVLITPSSFARADQVSVIRLAVRDTKKDKEVPQKRCAVCRRLFYPEEYCWLRREENVLIRCYTV